MPIPLKQPRRLSITVSNHLYQQLMEIADHQGRSLSNFAAFLLESSLDRGVDLQRTAEPAAMLRR